MLPSAPCESSQSLIIKDNDIPFMLMNEAIMKSSVQHLMLQCMLWLLGSQQPYFVQLITSFAVKIGKRVCAARHHNGSVCTQGQPEATDLDQPPASNVTYKGSALSAGVYKSASLHAVEQNAGSLRIVQWHGRRHTMCIKLHRNCCFWQQATFADDPHWKLHCC